MKANTHKCVIYPRLPLTRELDFAKQKTEGEKY